MQRQGSKNIKLSQTRPPFHTVAYKTLSCQDAPNPAAFETRGCPHKTQPRNPVERNSIIKHQPSLHIFLSLRIEIYTFFKKVSYKKKKTTLHQQTQNGSARQISLNQAAGRHPRLGSCNDEPPLIEGCGPSYFPSCAVAFALAKLPAMSTAASKFSARPSQTFRTSKKRRVRLGGERERGCGTGCGAT